MIRTQRQMYFQSITWWSTTETSLLWFTIQPIFWNKLSLLRRWSGLWVMGDLLLSEMLMGGRYYWICDCIIVKEIPPLVTGDLGLWVRNNSSGCQYDERYRRFESTYWYTHPLPISLKRVVCALSILQSDHLLVVWILLFLVLIPVVTLLLILL